MKEFLSEKDLIRNEKKGKPAAKENLQYFKNVTETCDETLA